MWPFDRSMQETVGLVFRVLPGDLIFNDNFDPFWGANSDGHKAFRRRKPVLSISDCQAGLIGNDIMIEYFTDSRSVSSPQLSKCEYRLLFI